MYVMAAAVGGINIIYVYIFFVYGEGVRPQGGY